MSIVTARRRSPAWGLIGLVLVAAAVVFPVRRGMESDRRLSEFCSSVPAGAGLEAARTEAFAQGFIVTDVQIEPGHTGISVSAPMALWPRSWCRLDHDAFSITGQTFEPWYE